MKQTHKYPVNFTPDSALSSAPLEQTFSMGFGGFWTQNQIKSDGASRPLAISQNAAAHFLFVSLEATNSDGPLCKKGVDDPLKMLRSTQLCLEPECC